MHISNASHNMPASDNGASRLGGRPWPLFAGAALAAIALIVLVAWLASRPGPPRLNSDTLTLVKFVNSEAFDGIAFEQKSQYLRILEDRQNQGDLKKLFRANLVSESEYRGAIQYAWLGQQLKRSDRYAMLVGQARAAYINDLVDKKIKKSNKPADTSNAVADEELDVKRDPALDKILIDQWPREVQDRYQAFRQAYDDCKRVREAALAPKTRPAGP
jgi:hypothetical protein